MPDVGYSSLWYTTFWRLSDQLYATTSVKLLVGNSNWRAWVRPRSIVHGGEGRAHKMLQQSGQRLKKGVFQENESSQRRDKSHKDGCKCWDRMKKDIALKRGSALMISIMEKMNTQFDNAWLNGKLTEARVKSLQTQVDYLNSTLQMKSKLTTKATKAAEEHSRKCFTAIDVTHAAK